MSDTQVIVQGGYGAQRGVAEQGTERLFRLVSTLKDLRRPWEKLYSEAARYMAPEYGDWDLTTEAEGKKQTTCIYNNKPVYYVNTVCAGLQGYLTPSGGNWIEYELEDRQLMNAPGVRLYLQQCRDHMEQAIMASGFYGALAEGYPQLVVNGTCTVMAHEDVVDDQLRFTALHPKHVSCHHDRYGNIDTWALTWSVPIVHLDQEYPGKLPAEIRDRLRDHPFEERLLTVLVTPRHVRSAGSRGASSKPWATHHLLEAPRVLLREGGTDTPPVITGRWTRASDEIYGRGLGLSVLSDVLRLNQLTKSELLAAQWAVDPAIMYPSEMREEIELVPGARIPYFNPAKEVRPLSIGGNYPIGKDAKNEVEMSVFEQLQVSFFLSLLQNAGAKTATEVMELQGEKAAILGTMIDRPTRELIIPMLARLWDYEVKAGRMPPTPRALERAGTSVRLKFVGPLMQIARRFHLHQGITQTLGTFAPLVEMSQGQVLDIVNWDELGRHVLENDSSFPKTAVHERREVAAIREQKAEEMQRQQQLQEMEVAGKAGPGLEKMAGLGQAGPGIPGMAGPLGQ